MSTQDHLPHECMGDLDKAMDNDCSPTKKERFSFFEQKHRLPLGASRDTLEDSVLDTEQQFPVETKLYKRRWVIVFLFTTYATSNAFMWLQYSIVGNIFMRFYDVDSIAIDWLSMIYLLSYITFIVPSMWLQDKWGMRVIMLLASALTCIGAWIKTSTAKPDMFALTFFGQFVCAVATPALAFPSRLASLWFGENEVSTACSIGVMGDQVCLCLPVSLKTS
uniref:Major facilitator superfamily (MFS) profile domain-containing protein n=1 Tax=Monopterus albus TaxID=43700 RepID=A0A3Q3J262_MONAL